MCRSLQAGCGHLTLACIPVMAHYGVTSLCSSFRRSFPGLRLTVTEREDSNLPDAVRRGTWEMAVCRTGSGLPRIGKNRPVPGPSSRHPPLWTHFGKEWVSIPCPTPSGALFAVGPYLRPLPDGPGCLPLRRLYSADFLHQYPDGKSTGAGSGGGRYFPHDGTWRRPICPPLVSPYALFWKL